jgi:hypothetical protein
MMRSHRGHAIRAGFAALIMGACLAPALHAQSTTFSSAVALSSQLVDRGQAMTRTTPILQGAASWTFPAGWSLGLSGSAEVQSPGHVVAALAQASRHWSLAGDWQMQANLLYYRYSGTARSRAFDRAEAGLSWTYRDVLTLGLSTIYVIGSKGQHRPRGAADISFRWPLARQLFLSAGAGATQSPIAPYNTYGYSHEYDHAGPRRRAGEGIHAYGHVGLLWSHGPWRIELDRILADPKTRWQWDVMGASPWVATISRSF